MAFEYAVVLTGGIATGKSTVAKIFKEYGFQIIDADKIAHEMLDIHAEEIIQLFGGEYVDNGIVQRKKLGALIFGNPTEKKRLEALLHPLIYHEIERQSAELDKLNKPYLVDIPLFFETKRYPIKESIVVYVPQALQLERLMIRDESDRDSALQRIEAQLSIEEKKQRATYLIDNQNDLKALQLECDKVKDKIIQYYKEKL
jgi:dephospho-CoA kinase